MSNQKSHKEYQHVTDIPLGMQINPGQEGLEICMWHDTNECQKSGLQDYVGKCTGYKKCFAYIPKSDLK